MTRINDAPAPKGLKPFVVPDPHLSDVPDSPPVEVLDALDRAARVLGDLDRKNVTIGLDTGGGGGPLRVLMHHPGTASAEISPRALLNLLDGESGPWPGGRRL